MTDWRGLCAELLQALETEGYAHWTVTPDKDELCLRTRAALAQPEPKGPPAVTTSVLLHPAYEPDDGSADGAQMVGMAWWRPVMGCDSLQLVVDNARNILRSRRGRPAIEPVPVAERLPGAEDCNAESECFWFDGCDWKLDTFEKWYTHWLPHHALPVPTTTTEAP